MRARLFLSSVLLLGYILNDYNQVRSQDIASTDHLPAQVETAPRQHGSSIFIPLLEPKVPEVRTWLTLQETDAWRQCAYRIHKFSLNGPLARTGLSNEWFLGSTPWGACSGSLDLDTPAFGGGVWLCLYWYPDETTIVSFQLDLWKGRLKIYTTAGITDAPGQ